MIGSWGLPNSLGSRGSTRRGSCLLRLFPHERCLGEIQLARRLGLLVLMAPVRLLEILLLQGVLLLQRVSSSRGSSSSRGGRVLLHCLAKCFGDSFFFCWCRSGKGCCLRGCHCSTYSESI